MSPGSAIEPGNGMMPVDAVANEGEFVNEDIEGQEGEQEQKQSPAEWLMQAVDHQNIAELLDEDFLNALGAKVIREYDIDKASRTDWEDRMEDAMDVALQVVEEKTFPWVHASNVKYPLLTSAAIQFAARAYPAIVNGSTVARSKVIGNDYGMPAVDDNGQVQIDPETQEPVWEVPPGAKRERGDRVARHMSWQLTEEMDEWEPDTDRLLHVLPIVGVVFRKTYFDSTAGKNVSEMVLPADLMINYSAKSMNSAPRITQRFKLYPHEITERIRGDIFLDEELGIAREGGSDEDAPHEFYEQHRLVDLDEDGYPEPYIVTVHKDTGKVMRIVAGFDTDSVLVNDEGEVKKITPHRYFTKYGFIPNPESAIYDLGFGSLLNPINASVDAILNQMIDSGTIQNAGGGFMSKGLRLKGGALRFAPGEYKKVESTGGKIADSIYQMQHSGPSPTMFALLGLLIDAGKEISSVQDVLTGDTGGIPQTATTTLALIEQGMKSFTAIFKRIHRSLKTELAALYDLNRRYMPQEAYFNVLDDVQAVAQADYEDESFDIVPVSDPSIVTDMQKLGRAEFLMGFRGDPFVDQMELRSRVFEAASIDDIDSILTGPPPAAPDPRVIKTIGDLKLAKELQPSEIAKNLASAIKSLADAGGTEGAPEIDTLMLLLEAVLNEFNRGEGLPGMEAQGGDQMVPGLPPGPM